MLIRNRVPQFHCTPLAFGRRFPVWLSLSATCFMPNDAERRVHGFYLIPSRACTSFGRLPCICHKRERSFRRHAPHAPGGTSRAGAGAPDPGVREGMIFV